MSSLPRTVGLTKSLSKEYGSRGVGVNMVAPGYIETDMTRGMADKRRAAVLSAVPMGRIGSPSDVADVVRFLCGPSSGYISGQVVAVDGGMT